MEGILVSDFDGTMTSHDFYKLAIELLLPPDVPNYWARYRAGEITHFEALRLYFAQIRGSEDEVLNVVRQMDLDPHLRSAVNSLRDAGWDVVVTSAGCDWYIRRLLAAAEVDVKVLANPGRFRPGEGLLMQMPADENVCSPVLGVDKARVVRHYQLTGTQVAFAGDGFPDIEAARLVGDDWRFARGDLAVLLSQEHLPFQTFNVWSEIADHLLRKN